MKTRIFFILILVSLVHQGWTQETYRHQFSSVPDSSRYEIVQSELGARFTFRIDKYNGIVKQLVEGEDGLLWQPMLSPAFMNPEEEFYSDKVNYQIFMSGLGARYTFLLNVNNGKTWQLTEEEDSGTLFWNLIE